MAVIRSSTITYIVWTDRQYGSFWMWSERICRLRHSSSGDEKALLHGEILQLIAQHSSTHIL